ncbi:MAG: hypothetical protein SPF89_11040 [Sphaerochaetaceae bacterium]|jgi:hypothetical protein|nr:hypothetical protein [Spirochaetales bacterium]MDY5500630.1 hypothetical protein [Sphaerochaetaceae bacterium]
MEEKAILYTSKAGHARQYAKMLASRLGIPAIEFGTEHLAKDNPVVFIGWIRAGNVVGLDEALSRYQIDAIGVVGLRYQNLQLVDNLQDRCGGAKVFYLQGGFEPNKLKGLNRLIIKIAAKTMVKNLKRKNPRNADEESMLEMLQKGGSRVTMEALDPMVHALRDPQD